MSRNANLSGHGMSVPPILPHVQIYFDQKGLSIKEAEAFYYYQNAHGWKTEAGTPIKNWKVVASNWIWDMRRSREVTLQLKINRNVFR